MKNKHFTNKETKKYYQQIHRCFPLFGKEEKRFLQYFKESLQYNEKKHPELTYQQYIEYFGSPEEVVSAFYEHIESEYIISHMKIRKFLKYGILTLICITIIFGTILIYTSYKAYQALHEDDIYYYEEVIEELS